MSHQHFQRIFMPIISIKTNHSLTSHQKEQLLNDVVTATCEALSVDKARIDASLQIISPDASVSCGKYKAPFIRYGVMMLAGRSLEAKQALVKRYDEAAKNIIAGGGYGRKNPSSRICNGPIWG